MGPDISENTVKVQSKKLWASPIPLLYPLEGGKVNSITSGGLLLQNTTTLQVHVLDNLYQV